jgi:hypothetical protein
MENKYLYPDKQQLENEYLKKYGEEFLKLNNLKVGDEVEMNFDYEGISSGYGRGAEPNKYTYKKLAKGILKITHLGLLYAESIENMPFFDWVNNNRTGRARRAWYQPNPKKSVIKFGVGYISRY